MTLLGNIIRLAIAILALPVAVAIDLVTLVPCGLGGYDPFGAPPLVLEGTALAFSRVVNPEGDEHA